MTESAAVPYVWRIVMEREIYLSRLSDKEELYHDTAVSLGIENTESFTADELRAFLSGIAEPCKFRIYISDEQLQNDTIDEITDIFRTSENLSEHISTEFITDEFLNIINAEGRITSQSKPRTLVHRDGDLHPTVHVWVIKRRDMGVFVLLQKRSAQKDTHPDCYDVSAAGHVSQGGEFREAAVRELGEELGLFIAPEKLTFIGMKENTCTDDANDNELCAVYLYQENVKIEQLKLQESEVSEVCWAEIDELLSVMDRNDFSHCIFAEELQMIKKDVF